MFQSLKIWVVTIASRYRERGLRVCIWMGVVLAIGSVGIFYFLKPYYLKAQEYDLGKLDDFDTTTIFYDKHNEEIGRLFIEDRTLLKHEQIPNIVREAVIAVEDKRFYHHGALDYQGLLRAARTNLKGFCKKEGGSTITQQLAKHLIGNFDKTFSRKILEAFLARRIEENYSKEQILDYYLNRIYFGKGYFGLAAAARGYFGKTPDQLTISDAALLAGIIKAPTNRSPRNDIHKARLWRDVAILKMRQQNFLTILQTQEALISPIELAPITPLTVKGGVRSYFMAAAAKELEEVLALHEESEFLQGLHVHTTLDLQIQRGAETELIKKLKEVESELNRQKIAEKSSSQAPLQGAALVMDLASGAVRVLIGGRDFASTPFDRATMARRENGALLHPFLYALAFEKMGLHPASMINSSFLPLSDFSKTEEVGLGDPKKDLTKRFLTVQDALAFSNKAAATRVGLELGNSILSDWLVKAGLNIADSGPAESSWSLKPLTMWELTSLYQMLGNSGVSQKPFTIEKVVNIRQEVIYQAQAQTSKPMIDPIIAQQLTLTLQAVTREGTASSLTTDNAFPVPAVGMTGYSEGYRDAWFIGYTPSLVGGVWLGFDQPLPLGNKAIATHSAVPLWGDIMRKALANDPKGLAFPIPKSLSKVEIDRQSGEVRGLGLLMPASGNIFVYLNGHQLNSVSHSLETTDIKNNRGWSDWLSTMVNTSEEISLSSNYAWQEGSPIPQIAEYHIPGLRGDILSADGNVLATTTESQSLVLAWPSPEVAQDSDDVLLWVRKHLVMASSWLGQAIDIPDSELHSLFSFQRFHPITVAENLTPKQIAAFHESALAKEDFCLQGIPIRSYPQGCLFSHGIGYLKRIQGRNRKQYLAGEVIYDNYTGAAGLEEVFNTELTGKDGQLTIVTTPEGFTKQATVKIQTSPD